MSDQIRSESKAALQLQVTEAEIKNFMFSLGSKKAPQPDTWKADVCKGSNFFFQSGKLLGEANSPIIILVPKVENPSRV